MKILITQQLAAHELDTIQQAVPGAQLIMSEDRQVIASHMADAQVIWGQNYPPELLPGAKNLGFIQVTSAGVDRLLEQEELQAHPVTLVNARGIHATTIAEHVFMLMLALARNLPWMHDNQKEHQWVRKTPTFLAHRTLGIIGYGSIGRAIARRARAFDMQVLATRRNPEPDEWAHEVLSSNDLHELLPRCDYLVLATPLTAETKHLVGAPELALCKKSAFLINIARGPVVDEPALITALQTGGIAGAGLDVFYEEPLAADNPLWDLPNVIVTPHLAGHMADYNDRVMAIFLENLRRCQAGETLINVVDKKAGY